MRCSGDFTLCVVSIEQVGKQYRVSSEEKEGKEKKYKKKIVDRGNSIEI